MSLFKRIAHGAFAQLCQNPSLLFRLQRFWLRAGHALLDLRMAAWVIHRPEWLITQSKPRPSELAPRYTPDAAFDEAVSKRIIASYRETRVDGTPDAARLTEGSMWGEFLQVNYATLRNHVIGSDSAALAKYLSTIFRTETVNGYTYGTTFDLFPHRWWYLPVAIELSVVTLAESVGILRAECPEQGEIAYWRSHFSEEKLIEALESMFGVRLEAPRIGDARGIEFGGRFLTRETCSHLYTAHRMRQAINAHVGPQGDLDIVEIGGGYGGLCYWLNQILPGRIHRYVIVDLPEVNVVQAYFLSALSSCKLVLCGEARPQDRPTIELLPHWRLRELDLRPNVLINQDSMPEMPVAEVERYLSWASENLDGLFLSFNQEAYSPWAGVPQVHVPTVVSRYPWFRRLARNTSWDRRGYVEEVYATS
jgi:hypothetical protein